MTSKPLDELYFEWLYKRVADPEQGLTFWKVLRVLYTTEFVWVVPNDENRIADARELREEFIDSSRIRLRKADRHWVELGCSMLELMVGLAERLKFQAERGEAYFWFWVLMENIGLSNFDDSRFNQRTENQVHEVMERIIQRYYEPNGHGGFFPLENPQQDQRQVELWYQLSEYVWERKLAG